VAIIFDPWGVAQLRETVEVQSSKLARLERLFKASVIEGERNMAIVEELKVLVDRAVTVMPAAALLINEVLAKLEAKVVDSVAIDEMVAKLREAVEPLEVVVAANVPAPEVPVIEEVPAEEAVVSVPGVPA
jgi:capsid protein